MDPAIPFPTASNRDRLRDLHGRSVLVRSSRDQRNPPTAVRGTVEVRERPDAPPAVFLAIEFPQMFTQRAHRRSIALDHDGVRRLLATESNGTFEFTIDEELS